MSDVVPVVAGVDTHKDVHVLCVLDGLGRQVFTGSFQANEDGYNKIATDNCGNGFAVVFRMAFYDNSRWEKCGDPHDS